MPEKAQFSGTTTGVDKGKTAHFIDGSTGEYDMILTATGDPQHYLFFDRGRLNWQGRHEQAEMAARYIAGRGTSKTAALVMNRTKAQRFG